MSFNNENRCLYIHNGKNEIVVNVLRLHDGYPIYSYKITIKRLTDDNNTIPNRIIEAAECDDKKELMDILFTHVRRVPGYMKVKKMDYNTRDIRTKQATVQYYSGSFFVEINETYCRAVFDNLVDKLELKCGRCK